LRFLLLSTAETIDSDDDNTKRIITHLNTIYEGAKTSKKRCRELEADVKNLKRQCLDLTNKLDESKAAEGKLRKRLNDIAAKASVI
jgi:septal ring factor EnvC (AmiA/AmiB activator)